MDYIHKLDNTTVFVCFCIDKLFIIWKKDGCTML